MQLKTLIFGCLLGAIPLFAQTGQPDLGTFEATFGQLQQHIQEAMTQSATEIDLVKQLGGLSGQVLGYKEQENSTLVGVHKKLDAFANTDENNAANDDVKIQYQSLLEQQDKIKANLAKADLLLAQIDDLNQFVAKRRSETLRERLLSRQVTLWDPLLWHHLNGLFVSLQSVVQDQMTLYQHLDTPTKETFLRAKIQALYTLLAGIVVAFLFGFYLRRNWGYLARIADPTYGQKLWAAFVIFIAKSLIPAAVIGFLLWGGLTDIPSLSPQFSTIIRLFLAYTFYLLLALGLVHILFIPSKPKWRLLKVKNDRARSLSFGLDASLIVIFASLFLTVIAYKIGAPKDTIYALYAVGNFFKAVCILMMTNRLLYDNKALSSDEWDNLDNQNLSTSSKISLIISVLTLGVLFISLIGFVRLGSFIFDRFIFSVLFAGLLYVLRLAVLFIAHKILDFRVWRVHLRMGLKKRKKIEFWIQFLTGIIVCCIGAFFLLAIWGVSVDLLLQKIQKLLTGFDVGGMHISILSLFKGLLCFWLTLLLSKSLRHSLTFGALSHLDIDTNVRNSLVAMLGFLGFVAAILVGITVIGGSLKGLAIIAGALSFGAGLGLQNVVNNFVSGVILLIERPIKIGDWVNINGQEVIIKKISMRSTVIETFNQANVIIPNADILSSCVTNITYQTNNARIDIPVKVPYGTDIDAVKAQLKAIGERVPYLSKTTAPRVIFLEFADGAYLFRLSVYVTDVNETLNIKTFINTEIVKVFQQHGLSLALPMRQVNLTQTKD